MFECVNESDEKGDGSDKVGYVAQVGGDIHEALVRMSNAVAATLGTCPFPRALSLSIP